MKQILLRPIITEKSMNLITEGKYSFEVNKDCNKIEVAQAIKLIYKVEPVKVNIINIKSRSKLFRSRTKGTTRSWQKALVTLKKGQKIAEFDVKK